MRFIKMLFVVSLIFFTKINAQNIKSNKEINNSQRFNTSLEIVPRIVGGTDAVRGDWPYIVALADKFRYDNYGLYQSQFCAGTLINKKWVLTAAHCVVDRTTRPEQLLLAVGAYSLANDDAVEHIVAKQIIVHPEYNHDRIQDGHDIALIELSTTSKVAPAKIVTDMSLDLGNRDAIAIGWGSIVMQDEIHSYGELYPSTLQQVADPTVDLATCSAHEQYSFNNTTLCAGYTTRGKGTCQGDSGGPLFIMLNGEYYQAGITSAGIGCAYGYYDLFANVATLSPFINQYVSLVSNVTGLWYDPALNGLGFNFVMAPNGLVIYYYGYSQNGSPLWLVGDPGTTVTAKDTSYTLTIYQPRNGNGANFNNKPNTGDSGISPWGTMSVQFSSCSSATATLTGNDGVQTFNLIKLANVQGISCSD